MFKNFKSKKSPGPDGFKPILFKYLPDKYINYLVLIYKACIELKFTPTAWKAANVIFIPKPGKADYTNPNSYRPITLSSCIFKVLERDCRPSC